MWVNDPCQSNVHNLNVVRREVSRHFRNKKKKYLIAKIEKLEDNNRFTTLRIYIGVSMHFRSGTNLDSIELRMTKVTCLQTSTVLWLGGGTISSSY